jgi:hypothetical protein
MNDTYRLVVGDIKEIRRYARGLFKDEPYYEYIHIVRKYGRRFEESVRLNLSESSISEWVDLFGSQDVIFGISIEVWAGSVFCRFPCMQSDYDVGDIIRAFKSLHTIYDYHMDKNICSLMWKKIKYTYDILYNKLFGGIRD